MEPISARVARFFRSLPASLPGADVEVVSLPRGVVVAQIRCQRGALVSLDLPCGPAVAVAAVATPPGPVAPTAGSGTTFTANLAGPVAFPFEGGAEVLVACFPLASFGQMTASWRLRMLPLPEGLLSVAHDLVCVHLIRALLSRTAYDEAPDQVFIHSIVGALQAHFLHLYCRRGPTGDAMGAVALEPWQLQVAEEAMLAQLDRRTAVDEIAEVCGLSAVHFSRAFRQATSQTPHRWLMDRRLDSARDMLEATRSTVAEIALVCGFSDQSHLTRAFAAAFGVTPGAWRAAHSRLAEGHL